MLGTVPDSEKAQRNKNDPTYALRETVSYLMMQIYKYPGALSFPIEHGSLSSTSFFQSLLKPSSHGPQHSRFLKLSLPLTKRCWHVQFSPRFISLFPSYPSNLNSSIPPLCHSDKYIRGCLRFPVLALEVLSPRNTSVPCKSGWLLIPVKSLDDKQFLKWQLYWNIILGPQNSSF